MHQSTAPIIRKPRSFFSTAALGVSAVLVTIIAGAVGLVIYGMNIVDRKTGNLLDFTQETIRGLPELAESLPPVLADVLNDRRSPDYAEQIDVSVALLEAPGHSRVFRPTIVVHNSGDAVVSLLSMRVVIVDENGQPVTEGNEWAATPFAADDEWRGPLLPGSTRRFTADGVRFRKTTNENDYSVDVEITDVRIWTSADKSADGETNRVAMSDVATQ